MKRLEIALALILAAIGIFQPERFAWVLLAIAALLVLVAEWQWLSKSWPRSGRVVVPISLVVMTYLVYAVPSWLQSGHSIPQNPPANPQPTEPPPVTPSPNVTSDVLHFACRSGTLPT